MNNRDELTPPVCGTCGTRMSRCVERVRIQERQEAAVVVSPRWMTLGAEYLRSPFGYALPTVWQCGGCEKRGQR